MDGSEVHHTKENKPDFERKKMHVFWHMLKLQ